MKLFLQAIVFFISIATSFAQPQHLELKNYKSEDGLSNNWVNTISEDDRGFLWVGTRSGLNIYDGHHNTILKSDLNNNNTLSSNDISILEKSVYGHIWVGTWEGGLNLVDPITHQVKRLPNGSKQAANTIKSLVEMSDTALWVGTYGSGFYRYDHQSKTFHECPYKDGKVEKFAFCQSMVTIGDTVWLSSRKDGVGYIAPGSDTIRPARTRDGSLFNIDEVTQLSTFRGRLLIGDAFGNIFQFHPGSGELKSFPPLGKQQKTIGRILSFSVEDQHTLWISSSKGIFIYHEKSNTLSKPNLSTTGNGQSQYYDTYIDSRGIVWLGSWGNGLNKYDPKAYKFHDINLSDKRKNVVHAILPLSDSSLLLGTSGGVVTCRLPDKKIKRYDFRGKIADQFKNDAITGIKAYGNNELLIMTESGIYIADNNKQCRQHPVMNTEGFRNAQHSILTKDRQGRYWIGSWASGVAMIDPKDGSYQLLRHDDNDPGSIASNAVFSVHQTTDNRIWVGTQEGISEYLPSEKRFINIEIKWNNNNYKTIGNIRSIREDDYGYLWLGTNRGIARFDPKTRESTFYHTSHGLPDEIIHSVFLDKNNNSVWATSNSGLIRFDTLQDRMINYTADDGLLSNEFPYTGIYKTDSNVYLGNGMGVVYFNPDDIEDTPHKTSFHITSLLINDNPEVYQRLYPDTHISNQKKITLKHGENNLKFQVAALNFSNAHSKLYAHKLKGFDEKWSVHSLDERTIKYTNLDPGKYELQISSADNYGALKGGIKTLYITIEKPIWGKPWFYVSIISFLVFLTGVFIQYRTRSIRHQNKLLEERVAQRTETINKQKDEKEVLNNQLTQSLDLLRDRNFAISKNIEYAFKIQQSLLPSHHEIKRSFAEYFIFFQPKDIVSGDFYWHTVYKGKTIVVTADCTGHGVSGALMSTLGLSLLRFIVYTQQITRPDHIIQHLSHEIELILSQHEDDTSDGMDISIMTYDPEEQQIEIASAIQTVLLINEEKTHKIKGDPCAVGSTMFCASGYKYKLHTYKCTQPTMVYLYSDGLQDQFGGPYNKKYMSGKFRKLLKRIYHMKAATQEQIIKNEFTKWKGSAEQIDDILVMGIRLGN